MYEVMRYWDDDHPEWDAEEQAFAAAWRKQPKWVVSRTLKSVGPNARLVKDDLEGAIRKLKAERDGDGTFWSRTPTTWRAHSTLAHCPNIRDHFIGVPSGYFGHIGKGISRWQRRAETDRCKNHYPRVTCAEIANH
jgi:hypothetical protein